MAIQIMTDSAADYTAAEIQRGNFICVPMGITFGEETFSDGVDLTRDQFYERLQGGEFPTTSQPSPADFQQYFKAAKKAGDDMIVVLISSELSGTYQGAMLAKEMVEYDRIFIIDSLNATVSMRILINRAIQMRAEGRSAEEIVEELEQLKGRIQLYAGLDTLEYLAKGGRISSTVANLGNLVNLKPIITLTPQGTVEMCGKQIGFNRTCRAVAKFVKENMPDPDYPVYYIYTHDKKNCLSFLTAMRKEGMNFGKPKLRGVGPTIGTHIGIGAFGIVYVRQ